MRKLYGVQISASINKVLLECSHAHLLCIICAAVTELSYWKRDCMVNKAPNIYCLPLCMTDLLDSIHKMEAEKELNYF